VSGHDHQREANLPDESGSTQRAVRDTVETILLAFVVYATIRLFVRSFRIEGSSMEPSMVDGQYILVGRWPYWFGSPQRGDVIVFEAPNVANRDLIKRVIGLSGEQVEIRNGQVVVDGERLGEPYAREGSYSGAAWTVGEAEVFVLGDNRDHSQDSRSWGPLPTDRIAGKAMVSYWPPQRWGWISPARY
jgi:signal peptidase I